MESTTSSPSTHTPPSSSHRSSSNIASSQANINGMIRYAALRDSNNHDICTVGNQRVLLAEKMNRLRALVKELEETDWMYETKNEDSKPIAFSLGMEERHFSIG
mmetsp:Transcript_8326/g.9135  ORF Transcript_8326/g.9135 Transcript_8326/m.9135 type:complete len:104 (+) Transcript_8326:116-427(+)